MMNKDLVIQSLIRSTINRTIRETLACLLIIGCSVFIAMFARSGGPMFYGALWQIGAACFISGVNWAYTLGYHLLREHPSSDDAFWRAAFMAQARLLRLVPYWYLAPLLPGFVLIFSPTGWANCLGGLLIFAITFVAITRLNLSAAQKLESNAQKLFA